MSNLIEGLRELKAFIPRQLYEGWTDFITLESELVEERGPLTPIGEACELLESAGYKVLVPAPVEEPATAGECCKKCIGPWMRGDTTIIPKCFNEHCPHCHRSQAEKGCGHKGRHMDCPVCADSAPKELPVLPEPLENEEINRDNIVRIAFNNRQKLNEILAYLRHKEQ